jgi:DNA helicase HerA-like ATPase
MELTEAKIGRVVNVAGSQIVMLIEQAGGAGATDADVHLQMGELVKLRTTSHVVFGMVTGLSIPIPSQDPTEGEMKIVEVELVGETGINGEGGFRRGVSVFPALGDSIYRTVHEDLELVYARPAVSTVRIGTIHQDQELPAYIATDDLLGKHLAVLGTTGSGKSCAVALILHAILDEHPNGHVVLLDPHNEYSRAFGERAEVLSPGNLKLPYWLFNFEEIVEVILGKEAKARAAETAILNEVIPEAKRIYLGESEDGKFVTVDTPIPYQLSDLVQLIDEAMGKLDNPENSAPYMRLKSRFNALRRDSRFAFMFGGLAVRDNMTEILSRIFRIPVAGKPITIMDLSGIPSEILNVVVSVLCRMTFDFALWSERAVPIMLVCEEAHRYAPQDSSLGFEPTKKALSQIAKEGRKYGVSLCMVTQRPSELASGILSQCNTIFALRMGNQNDQEFVRATLWESARGLLDFLPSLRNSEAIAVGEGVSIPVRLCFDTLPEERRPKSGTAPFSAAWQLPEERRPKSGTAPFSAAWQQDWDDADFLDQVVHRWRRQRR